MAMLYYGTSARGRPRREAVPAMCACSLRHRPTGFVDACRRGRPTRVFARTPDAGTGSTSASATSCAPPAAAAPAAARARHVLPRRRARRDGLRGAPAGIRMRVGRATPAGRRTWGATAPRPFRRRRVRGPLRWPRVLAARDSEDAPACSTTASTAPRARAQRRERARGARGAREPPGASAPLLGPGRPARSTRAASARARLPGAARRAARAAARRRVADDLRGVDAPAARTGSGARALRDGGDVAKTRDAARGARRGQPRARAGRRGGRGPAGRRHAVPRADARRRARLYHGDEVPGPNDYRSGGVESATGTSRRARGSR